MSAAERLELAQARLRLMAEELELVGGAEDFVGPGTATLYAKWIRESIKTLEDTGALPPH